MTSISAVSAGSAWSLQQSNDRTTTRQAFQQLGSALQSGDLADAQSAYATLSQAIGNNQNNPFASSLQQIGNALQSGDISEAQSAFGTLQQQMQTTRAHHHHHHGAPSGGAQNAQAVSNSSQPNSASTDGTGSIVNILA